MATIRTESATRRWDFQILGMSCASCVEHVTQSLKSQPNVVSAGVSLATERAFVEVYTIGNTAPALVESVKGAGYRVREETEKLFMKRGKDTASIEKLASALRAIPGVTRVDVGTPLQHEAVGALEVSFLPDDNVSTEIYKAVKSSGYDLADASGTAASQTNASLSKATARQFQSLRNQGFFSLAIMIVLMVMMNYAAIPLFAETPVQVVNWIMLAIATPIHVFIGGRFYKSAWGALKHRSANMNTLIAMGMSAAYVYSMAVTLFPSIHTASTFSGGGVGSLFNHATGTYFDVSVAIIGFTTLGRWLEQRAKFKTHGALRRLTKSLPRVATVIVDGQPKEINLQLIEKGHLLYLRPGERVPVDGVVKDGSSYVNESLITGESMPVYKKAGDTVFAGTVNEDGALHVTADKVGKDAVIGQIVSMVEKAQSSRAPVERLADRVTARFVPAILIIATVTFIIWSFAAPDPWFLNALLVTIGVLVISCPCALGLATPTAIVAAIGKGAERGILIKEAEALEVSEGITVVALDKTGTVTEGKPTVSSIVPMNMSNSEILRFAAAVESGSEHPIAKAVVAAAREQGIPFSVPSDFQSVPGKGAHATIDGHIVSVGSRSFIEGICMDMKASGEDYNRMASRGETVVFVAIDSEAVGIIGIVDKPRVDAERAVYSLHKMGIRTVMLTGDNRHTAAEVARRVGISDVHAEMSPMDKALWVNAEREKGERVAMIGDGVNDAPALAAANLGVAMARGTDLAMETAQITLKGSIMNIPYLFMLGKAGMRTIRQNLIWGFLYNVVLIPIAAGVLYPLFTSDGVPSALAPLLGAYGFLNPILAAAAMAFSSVTVVMNSLRLSRKNIGRAMPSYVTAPETTRKFRSA